MRQAEAKLNYPFDERTRFKLRLESYPDSHDLAPSEVVWVKNLRTLEAAQQAYLDAVAASNLGGSRFLPGEVFDEAGQHIAWISYNGRLWAPETWTPGMTAVAEALARPAYSLSLDGGKYEVVRTAAGEIFANRHGERWRELLDEPVIVRLATEVHEARQQITERGGNPLEGGEAPASYGPDKDMLRITLNDGTEIVQTAEGRVHGSRNGSSVEISVGDKLLLSLAYELEGARAALALLEPSALPGEPHAQLERQNGDENELGL